MEAVEVAIVGAGPVGLTLACLLAQRGVAVAVLESRTERSPHSRAIGIHPPALDVLRTLRLGEALAAEGVAIGGGQVFYGEKRLGRLALPEAPLALPQARTEALLEARLAALAPGALRRNHRLIAFEQDETSVRLLVSPPFPPHPDNGEPILSSSPLLGPGETQTTLTARLLVGCDGTHSMVRTLANLSRSGSAFPDRYLMGDFADDTEFGSDAALFFSREGIVESFPLPNQRRRWVARLSPPLLGTGETGEIETLAALVFARTRRRLPVETCSWLSPFGIEGFVADTFLRGRVALLGDAAHVVSPIGGQGMNLGILGAAALAAAWQGTPESLAAALTRHRRRALLVARRAAFNTQMGRPLPPWSPRRGLLTAGLSFPPLADYFAHAFTMRDLSLEGIRYGKTW